MTDNPECTWCGFPIIPAERKFARVVDGQDFCSRHCAEGYAKDPTRDAHGCPYPRAGGHSAAEDRETWCHWVVFDNDDIGPELAEHVDSEDLACALTGWGRSYGGPGRAFNDAPFAVRGRFHTLVRQRGGLDI